MSDFYDREGNPLSLLQWAALFEDFEYKKVAQDKVGMWTVSTVWLGSNHQYGEGPPLIFETMIFHEKHGYAEFYCERYSTEKEAGTGHLNALLWAIEREDVTDPPYPD